MTTPPNHALPGRYTLRLLVPSDLAALMALRQQVLAGLPLADLYVREADEPAFVARHLGPSGATFGVFDGEALAAYAMLGLPQEDAQDNLARWLPSSGHDDPARCAVLASCMVHAAHRGQGLQRVLLAARFALALERGRPLCVAAASLHNHTSRRNLMCEGMRIAWTGELMGLQRQLLAVHLQQAWRFAAAPREAVHCLDFERQHALTNQGLFGIESHDGSHADAIIFATREA